MSYTSPTRPGELPVPDYVFVPGKPDKDGIRGGCTGCAFRHMPEVRCSRIPCHRFPGLVAQLVKS